MVGGCVRDFLDPWNSQRSAEALSGWVSTVPTWLLLELICLG